MQVIPVLDIRSGRAVHARGGARSTYAPVSSQLVGDGVGDPIALARAYRTVLHCAELYVADLDAILAGAPQHDVVRAVAAQGGSCWVDMAVDSPHRAIETMEDGASRVVVGLETLTTREETLRLTRLRFEHGVTSEIDFRLAQSLTESSRAALAQTERQRATDINALALLLGAPVPPDFTVGVNTLNVSFPDVPAGLPSRASK